MAQVEINEHTDLAFEYTLKKTGKRITDIEFKFKRPAAKSTVVVPPPYADTSRILERLVTDFRLRQDQAEKIVNQFPPKEINRTLYDINLKKKDIANIGAYTAKTFNV